MEKECEKKNCSYETADKMIKEMVIVVLICFRWKVIL